MVEFLVVIVCLVCNAALSCIEMAFVTVSRPHLKKLATKGDPAAARVLRLRENPERTLSILQVGITLVGAISAAVGGAGAEEHLSPWMQSQFHVSEESAEALAIVAVVIPLTFFSVVIGELVPKSLALRFPMRLAMWGGLILQVLDKIFAPLVSVLDFSTRLLMKAVFAGFKAENASELNSSVDLEPLSETNKQYVLNLISIDKRTVKDIFVPWDEVTQINIADHYTVVLQTIKDSRHTRIPVIQEGVAIGILHAKEFVSEGEVSRLDWTELIRPVLSLDPKERILATFKKLQASRNHLGIVVHNNEPLGIVTIEDILEEFVGDIFDEDDSPRTLLSANAKLRNRNRS
jgi:putative hemolysin